MVKDDDLVTALSTDYRRANLEPRTRAILDHAVKLTLAPRTVAAADLDHLRAQGLTDQAILMLTETVAFFNWTNRVAMGLGLEPPT